VDVVLRAIAALGQSVDVENVEVLNHQLVDGSSCPGIAFLIDLVEESRR